MCMYDDMAAVLHKYGGTEVQAYDMYADIFRLGDGYIQKEGADSRNLVANPIMYCKNNGTKSGKYRILFEDTFKEILQEGQQADFCIINGITYFGRKNLSAHASKMFALIIDLDGVGVKQLESLMRGAVCDGYMYWPMPNYITISGHGVHFYYVLEEPISLYPNIKLQLKELKYALIKKLWNEYTSTIDKPQFQGINQGFRPPGGRTKVKGYISRVFCMNSHPMLLRNLSKYVEMSFELDEEKLFRESKLTLAQAKTKYPEWYEKVVVQKKKTVKKWDIQAKVHGKNPIALYDWWLNKIKSGATYHHRYFCIMCLVIYAIKVGVPKEKVKADSYSLLPYFNTLTDEDKFTKNDIESALELYEDRYCTFPVKDISKLSDIPIQLNKRNGRKQADHLKRARAVRDVDYPDGEWRKGNGRKSKRNDVEQWQQVHPNGTKMQCHKDTGLSRTTIDKYWKI